MNFTWLYVAALYAIGSRVLRVPIRVAALFYLLVLVFLFGPLTQPVVIVPVDTVKLLAPWSELRAPNRPPVTKYDVSNLNIHDVPMQIVPWIHQTRTKAWVPLLANGQSTPLSPLRLLVRPLPLGYAMTAEAALKLLVALTLMFLLCRARYSLLASVVAAIAYGFSTWMTVWLQFPIAAAAAFLPGVILVIDRLLENSTRQRFLAAVLMLSATVLSGHPETVFNVGLIALGYCAWWLLVIRRERRGWTPALHVAASGIVAMLITSPFLIVFAQAVVRSQRYAEARAPRESLIPPFSDLPSAILLVQPRFFGELPIERPWGPTTLESLCGFAGVLSLVSVVAAAIFIVTRRRWRERETFYVLGFVASVAIVLGWPGITEAFHAIAGLAPAMRMRLGICWFASLLIAAVIDWSRSDTRIPVLIGAFVVAATIMAMLRTVAFPSPAHHVSAVLSLLPSVAVLAALVLPRIEAAAALTVVELFVTMSRWNPELPLREWYPVTPLITTLQKLDSNARIVGTGTLLYPCTGSMFGFEDVRPHDPMANARYVEWLSKHTGWDPKNYYAKWTDTETSRLDDLGVKYVLTEPERELQPPRYQLRYAGRDGRIYENINAKPPFYSNEAHIEIVRASPESYVLRVHAEREALVGSTILHDPVWRVRGAKRFRHDEVFLGLVVPAGDHEIAVRYLPLELYAASAVSLLTLATLLVLARRRRSNRLR